MATNRRRTYNRGEEEDMGRYIFSTSGILHDLETGDSMNIGFPASKCGPVIKSHGKIFIAYSSWYHYGLISGQSNDLGIDITNSSYDWYHEISANNWVKVSSPYFGVYDIESGISYETYPRVIPDLVTGDMYCCLGDFSNNECKIYKLNDSFITTELVVSTKSFTGSNSAFGFIYDGKFYTGSMVLDFSTGHMTSSSMSVYSDNLMGNIVF